MQKRAPTLANLLVIVLFVLSCFGLLLFLWESFGGSVPLKPQGYRFSVNLPAHAAARRRLRCAHQRRAGWACREPRQEHQRPQPRDG